ncbi:RNA recognition motif domain [Macleaya cordata]|uniref:RNA recognition motif domain n=1 Tax=Macleaya cordata TaxID=56857 RepID=A0A200RCX4_MACCD|nr:RNA recognition motif domain [Macleaya cordata]
MTEKEQNQSETGLLEEGNEDIISNDKKVKTRKNKRKKLLLKETAKAEKRGVCYLSRIPPHMDPLKLRHILSQYGEIERIYLTPEDPAAQVHRKRAGGFRGQQFSEGWVEFTKKTVAKRVASMLNGEQIGGRKRSSFFYDIWNIKYLSKFKWDDLTDEIAYKNAVREQKLTLEISAAKRERDFYLSKVDKSHALSSIQQRMMKKQKVQQGSDTNSVPPAEKQEPKVIRQFPQTRPVGDNSNQSKPRLSSDILAGILPSALDEYSLF